MEDRKQFTFYASFAAALARVKSKAARCDAYDAIVAYALYGVEPDLDSLPDSAAVVVSVALPILEASRRKALGGKRGRSGKDADSSAETTEEDTAKIPQRYEEDTANKNKNKNKNKIKYKSKENSACARVASHRPKDPEEVAAYCKERGNTVDPREFWDFYESKGWKVGNQPMKDWRAAVRTWEARRAREGPKIARSYDIDELEVLSGFDLPEEGL